ncbi:hypothetical protein ACFW91_28590 [Streptomyces asoensis]|uniref:hypothetical protein n=1 Tax=Streptomyces asoensis TaxID=249586 RepID=UPI0036B471FB
MSASLEWLVWGALVLLVFWLYQIVDLTRPFRLPRRKPTPPRVPHWARHGHLPPHGRHRR